ncbi:hypothetical protein DAMA08_026530 [Martiniozyma asiatica (nom. inval.)]|nr:hypothetical protein DAMA08_026530 [Martiniozyma asiatica]
MSFPPVEIQQLVDQIASILISNNQTLGVSEGACGGLLSAYIISIPGASTFFDGGRLIYSLRSRLKLSGWDIEQIKSYTGPSEQVALKLARNLRVEFGSSWIVSETGYAGPTTKVCNDNASINSLNLNEDEVGTVYLGISGPTGNFSKKIQTGITERQENMQLFAKLALEFLLEILIQQK